MKLHILDIRDGNGCRLIVRLTKDDALQAAQDWLNKRPGSIFPAFKEWFDGVMDDIQAGKEVNLANGDYIILQEADLDLDFVTDAMEDAQLTLTKALDFAKQYNGKRDAERIKSRCLATEQVLHLTLQKLKGQP